MAAQGGTGVSAERNVSEAKRCFLPPCCLPAPQIHPPQHTSPAVGFLQARGWFRHQTAQLYDLTICTAVVWL